MVNKDNPLTPIAERYEEGAPAAVLTKSQRSYVLGEKDLTDKQARAVQSRIRRRVETALYDIALLWRVLPDEELEATKEVGDAE